MSKHKKYTPKHAAKRPSRAAQVPKAAARTTLVVSTMAVGVTGVAVAGGVVTSPTASLSAAAGSADAITPLSVSIAPSVADAEGADSARQQVLSRSADRRAAADPAKEAALSQEDGPALTRSEDVSALDPRSVARALLGEFGFSSDQFGCLDSLWTRESGWRVTANNPSSSAYGIPQALPGSKMSSAGPDWATNAETQIRWGLGYIRDRYGSPCGAWSHSQGHGWY